MDREPLTEVLEALRDQGIDVGPIRRSGATHLGFSCLVAPWRHEGGSDRDPSMTAVVDSEGPSILKCHGCGYVGTLERTVDKLNEYLKGSITELSQRIHGMEKKRMLRVKLKPEKYRPRNYSPKLAGMLKDPFPPDAIEFLKAKGCTLGIAQEMRCAWLEHGRFQSPSGYFYHINRAIVFPTLSYYGDRRICVGAQVREIKREEGRRKYNTIFSYDVYRHFFGEHLLGDVTGKKVFLVEGPLDHMHLRILGLHVMGLLGLYLSNEKAIKIKMANPRKVYVILDPDKAGKDGSEGVLEKLKEYDIPSEEIFLTKDPKLLTPNDIKNLFPLQD